MINRIVIEGRLTADPVKKTSKTGKDITTFSIANSTDFGDKHVNFFFFFSWGKLGEVVIQYCKKGVNVIVDGVLRQDSVKSPDGQTKQYFSITVEKIRFFGEKKEEKKAPEANFDDDMPF